MTLFLSCSFVCAELVFEAPDAGWACAVQAEATKSAVKRRVSVNTRVRLTGNESLYKLQPFAQVVRAGISCDATVRDNASPTLELFK